MNFIFYAFRVTIGTYTVRNRSNWRGISTGFNMELVVTSTKPCKNVSMANISNHRREIFSNVVNYSAAILSAEDKFAWILSNSQNVFTRVFKWHHSSLHACFIFYLSCKNVSMANISNIRNISFVSKYKLKFSICPKFLTFV
jgi:hypothetical protein